MKSLKYFIASFLIIIQSCNFFNAPEIQKPTNENIKDSKQVRQQLDWMTDFSSGLNLSGYLVKDVPDRQQKVKYFDHLEGLGNENVSWQDINRRALEMINSVIKENEISDQERLYTYSIQSVSLDVLRYHLIKNTPSIELANAVSKYMDILLRHHSIDLDIMTDAIIHVKGFMKKKDYEKYKEYLLDRAEEFRNKSAENIESAVNEFNDLAKSSEPGTAEDRNNKYLNMRKIENNSKEAAYVFSKLLE